ncbi:hypothetical protein TKK_0012871 [Trichogramma kaykai]
MSWKGISVFRQAIKGVKTKLGGVRHEGACRSQQCEPCPEPKCRLDFACKPEGCWADRFAQRDKEHTQVLYAGLAFFTVTIFIFGRKPFDKREPDGPTIFGYLFK